MGYKSKLQKVERPTNTSYYFILPAPIGQALELEKGEEFEWTIENKNLLLLKRFNKQSFYKKNKSSKGE
ncbi:MAG TPA: hypothetical protein PLQ81_12650 [bacterium]|nr:hypothetical protein [bacterium]